MSSKVWLSGEYWNVPMAYFHELGHTNYLHHAMKGGCAYCDLTCPMVRLCVCGGGVWSPRRGEGEERPQLFPV